MNHDVKYVGESPILFSYYGGILMINGKFEEARPYLEQSVALDPLLGTNLNNLALWYEHKKNYAKAKSLYWKNIQLNNNRYEYTSIAYQGLAHIALHEGNFRDAKRLSEIALKEVPMDNLSMEYLAIAEYELGEKEESLKTIQQIHTYAPNSENEGLYLLIKAGKLTFPILQNSGIASY